MPQPLNSFELIRLKRNKFQLQKRSLTSKSSAGKKNIISKNFIYVNPNFV